MESKSITSILDLTGNDIKDIFDTTFELKNSSVNAHSNVLSRKILGMIFEKSSMRTRVSFEVAMTLLGGHSIYLTKQDINLGHRESIKDGANVLSRYVDCIAIRTYAHQTVVGLAKEASIPVINALSDYSHPCQALADLYTIKEKRGKLDGLTVSYVGDGNNVARSLAFLCAKIGVAFKIASPQNYKLPVETVSKFKEISTNSVAITQYDDPKSAVKDADVIYTDTWISMGQESEAEVRRNDFQGYQVNKELVDMCKKDVLVMHCLPAHRGEEITDDVIDGPHSVVYDQAENRMHIEKALLKLLIK